MKMRHTILYDDVDNIYWIYTNNPPYIECDRCKKELPISSEVCIHVNHKAQDEYICLDCFDKERSLNRLDMYMASVVTTYKPKNFKVVTDFNPLLSGGTLSVWDTDKVQGNIVDNTILANRTPSIEGASISIPIEDASKDKPIRNIKQIDNILGGTPILPGTDIRDLLGIKEAPKVQLEPWEVWKIQQEEQKKLEDQEKKENIIKDKLLLDKKDIKIL